MVYFSPLTVEENMKIIKGTCEMCQYGKQKGDVRGGWDSDLPLKELTIERPSAFRADTVAEA